ncbi:hypothetical protein QQ045_000682 [Rhodiola kirilowii]
MAKEVNSELVDGRNEEEERWDEQVEAVTYSFNGKLLVLLDEDDWEKMQRIVLTKIWNVEDKVSFKELANNLVLVNFKFKSYLIRIREGGPWHCMYTVILMHEWCPDLAPEEFPFNKLGVWAQFHNLPVGAAINDREVGEKLARFIGKFIKRRDPLWVSVKCERLPDRCVKCERITHVSNVCDSVASGQLAIARDEARGVISEGSRSVSEAEINNCRKSDSSQASKRLERTNAGGEGVVSNDVRKVPAKKAVSVLEVGGSGEGKAIANSGAVSNDVKKGLSSSASTDGPKDVGVRGDSLSALVKIAREGGLSKETVEVGNVRRRIQTLKQKLQVELDWWLAREETLWLQRSRILWMKQGDKNTKFFHTRASQRRQKERSKVVEVVTTYFSNIFQSSVGWNGSALDSQVSCIIPMVSEGMNSLLLRDNSEEEIKVVVFSLGPLKAPGIDGFPAIFFIKNIGRLSKSAFVKGRIITDNFVVAHEVANFIKNCKGEEKFFASVKVDMSKAYDRVEWEFLERVLLRLGFAEKWVDMIMKCVELLNARLREGVERGQLSGVRICRNAPVVSHLFFADDSIFFLKTDSSEACALKGILQQYEFVSGQMINFEKFEICFSRNTPAKVRLSIYNVFRIPQVRSHSKYLGLPLLAGQRKTKIFRDIVDKVWRRIKDWKCRLLSAGGREVLIKARATYRWKFSSTGIYTVKSGYEIINLYKDRSRRDAEEQSDRNAVNLRKRGINVELRCRVCGYAKEIALHVAKECWWDKSLATQFGLVLPQLEAQLEDSADWLWWCLKRLNQEDFCKLLIVAWLSWRNRNSLWHDKEGWSIRRAVILGKNILNLRSHSLCLSTDLYSGFVDCWCPPAEGVIKINIDGAWEASSRKADLGVVARDHRGTMLWC